MKKDYIPVSADQACSDESTFIEDFWTQRWDGVRHLPEPEAVSRTEVYGIMQLFVRSLPAGSRILDGGCGMGAWTVFLANQGFDVVGLDISQRTIARLNELLPSYQFLVGDIRETEFADASFDAYFSWGTFEHFEDGLGKCFGEARRILKRGGYLFLSVPFQNRRHLRRDKRELRLWDENYDKQRGYASEMRFYQWRLTKSEFQREFEINGFKALRVEAINKWQGLHRAVTHDLHIDPGSRFHRILQVFLYPLVPKDYVAHMIMGIGQRI